MLYVPKLWVKVYLSKTEYNKFKTKFEWFVKKVNGSKKRYAYFWHLHEVVEGW